MIKIIQRHNLYLRYIFQHDKHYIIHIRDGICTCMVTHLKI